MKRKLALEWWNNLSSIEKAQKTQQVIVSPISTFFITVDTILDWHIEYLYIKNH